MKSSQAIQASAARGPAPPRSGSYSRSLVSKLILLLIVFIAVPVILYHEFRQADRDKQTLILESVREQGRIIAQSLRPLLQQQEPSPFPLLNEELKRFATQQTGVKVLFRPKGEYGSSNFFFVASQPPVTPADLEAERDRLVERGVFDNISESCWGDLSIVLRHRRTTGEEELLTSITPVTTDAGCWVIITTHSTDEYLGTSLGQPYWQTLEVRLAAAIYLCMAIITIGLFVTIWGGLMRFRRLAREIRTGADSAVSFADRNRVPELTPVAEEFDRMTSSLQESATSIRVAAEDNAHAFKTPIAIMRQALEPLRRLVPHSERRGQRALDVIELSIDRLDHLVVSSRRLDETTAELIDPPRMRVDMSSLIERMLSAYSNSLSSKDLRLEASIVPRIYVLASEDVLETVFENLIDNAIEASPRGGTLAVTLQAREGNAVMVLSDQGQGVPDGDLERIFERYVSLRPQGRPASERLPAADGETRTEERAQTHLGIGLWIVRRNVQAIGGNVSASNRPGGGLALTVVLPLTL